MNNENSCYFLAKFLLTIGRPCFREPSLIFLTSFSFVTMKNSINPLRKLTAAPLLPTRLGGQALWRQLLLCCVLAVASSSQANPVAAGAAKASSPNEKVLICHNGHTINVSINALPAHLAHGDQIGSCSSEGGSGEIPIIWARNSNPQQISIARR